MRVGGKYGISLQIDTEKYKYKTFPEIPIGHVYIFTNVYFVN